MPKETTAPSPSEFVDAPVSAGHNLPNGKLDILHQTTFPSDRSRTRLNVHFTVRSLFASGQAGVASVRVPLPKGARTLALIVDPLDNGNFDHACWCYPRFHW